MLCECFVRLTTKLSTLDIAKLSNFLKCCSSFLKFKNLYVWLKAKIPNSLLGRLAGDGIRPAHDDVGTLRKHPPIGRRNVMVRPITHIDHGKKFFFFSFRMPHERGRRKTLDHRSCASCINIPRRWRRHFVVLQSSSCTVFPTTTTYKESKSLCLFEPTEESESG